MGRLIIWKLLYTCGAMPKILMKWKCLGELAGLWSMFCGTISLIVVDASLNWLVELWPLVFKQWDVKFQNWSDEHLTGN